MRAAVRHRIMTTINSLPFYNKLLESARMSILSSSSVSFINESIPLPHFYFTFYRRFLALLATHLRLIFQPSRLPLGKENHLSSVSLKLHHYTNCLIKSFLVVKLNPRRPRWLSRQKTRRFLHLSRPCQLLPLKLKHLKIRLFILNWILLSCHRWDHL